MGYGFGGGKPHGEGYAYGAPYFDGSFIIFLILILLVFGTGFFPGYYYGAEKK